MENVKELQVREEPTDLQLMTANEHAEVLKQYGGKKDGFLFDVDGKTIYAVTLDDKGKIKSAVTIKMNVNHPNLVDYDENGMLK